MVDTNMGNTSTKTTKKKTLTEDEKQILRSITNENGMDENNKQIVDTYCEDSLEKGLAKMFVHPQTGKRLTYGEMRMLYG
tara:strand:- start:28534 stop:28773 length:240 start_codon:yes stop_codon:yes gene_type:complete